MQKMLILFLGCMAFSLCSEAQFTRYIIKLKNKADNPFSISNPSQFLSQRALDRRARYNISIDSSDLPVTPRYLDSLRLAGNVTIINISKWLNQVAIQTTDVAALDKINSFPFVISASPVAARSVINPVNKKLSLPADNTSTSPNTNIGLTTTGYYDYGRSNGQVKIHNGDFLHNHGFRGEGMQMAVLDAGFLHYLTLPTFDSIRNNNQILGTWDFVANEASVDEDYYHGMQCLSTIAANIPGTFVGTAPKASFYLYRTEDVASEYPIEEQNWAAGIEKADSLGVDITSTSLGYYDFDNAAFNYTYNDMNGNTSISARAADYAAKKGMLMVAAAGNEGNNAWHYLITPSDADSIMSVGAVDTLGRIAGFSSYGPSSDGQVKPGVAAVGWNAIVANTTNGLPGYSNGTSFACPNMAGITTCLWQAFPEINNMGIINALQMSATKASIPDDRVGYGIPDAKKAFVMLLKKLYTQSQTLSNCSATLHFSIKTDNTMSLVIQRKSASEIAFTTIATLQDNGPYGLHNLSYTDDLGNVEAGSIEYAISMNIGSDTSFSLGNMTIMNAPCSPTTENKILVSPNPVSDDLHISISRIDNTLIAIVLQNAAGQVVYRNNYQQLPGTQTSSIPMQNSSKGIYFVTIYINNKKEVTKKIIR